IAEPLARLIDVALEQRRTQERLADAEAARRADVAKTAVLHAISHDLRTPLTAIATASGGLGDPDLDPGDRADLASVIGIETERRRGIAASHRRHVFEPFYRGPGSRGSGLGLAICRGFVEANGGRIRLLADTGEGTAFAVSLPLVQQPAPAP